MSAKEDKDQKISQVFQQLLEIIIKQLDWDDQNEFKKQTQKIKEIQIKSQKMQKDKKSCC